MAAHMANVLLTSLSEKEGKSLLPWAIEAANEHQLLQSENVQAWVSHINTSLGTAKTRLEGLCLLGTVVRQCSAGTFIQHGTSWIRMLTQVLQAYDSPLTLQMASHDLACVVQQAAQYPEVAREVASTNIPALVQCLLGAQDHQWFPSALEALHSCMKNFPGPCGPSKGKIESLVCGLMDTNQPRLSQLLQQTCPLLAGCGGGGAGGVKYKEAWTHLCDQVLGSLHQVLDHAYQDIETGLQTYSVPQVSLRLKAVPESDPVRTFVLSTRFHNLCGCLQQLVSQDFPSVVRIPVPDILALLCRALGVNAKMLFGKASMEHMLLMSVLPKMHCSALSLLEALIISCRSHLVPHASVISQLLVQTLGWTTSEEGVPGRQKPHSTLRSRAYTVLTVWLNVCGAASGVDSHADVILQHVIKDATPQADTTKLKANRPGSQDQSRRQKKKQRGVDVTDQGLTGHRKVDSQANSDVCSAALEALKTLLEVVGSIIKPSIHKETQEFVIPLLLKIHQNQSDPPIPYSCARCRKGLYQLLLAAVLVLHPRWPPPTHCAVKIFSVGQQDYDLQVSSYCREALLTCMSIIHPRAPTLQSPVIISDTPTISKPSTNHLAPSFQMLRTNASETMLKNPSSNGNLFTAPSFKSASQSEGMLKDQLRVSQSESTSCERIRVESSDVPESFSKKLRREEDMAGPSVIHLDESSSSSEGQSSSEDSVEFLEDVKNSEPDSSTLETGEPEDAVSNAGRELATHMPDNEDVVLIQGHSEEGSAEVPAGTTDLSTTAGVKRKHESDGEGEDNDSQNADIQAMLAAFVPDSTPDDY
ncbi:proline-, glutamic acid- and leucine-rich protein 1-like isoform X2 [Branchiostoma lanceolatum]|uniref:proline-, glutamic acid- and leucine-rich protein 1-like isoform X2 n=1 Tax=Branchiostoma lanceolatum TaxID=7740 RepID=UPI0034546005